MTDLATFAQGHDAGGETMLRLVLKITTMSHADLAAIAREIRDGRAQTHDPAASARMRLAIADHYEKSTGGIWHHAGDKPQVPDTPADLTG